jgi:hypothetical protein
MWNIRDANCFYCNKVTNQITILLLFHWKTKTGPCLETFLYKGNPRRQRISKILVKLIEKGVFGKYGYSRPSLFWDVTWCMLSVCYRRFEIGCRFHIQRSNSQRLLEPWWRSQYIVPKRR